MKYKSLKKKEEKSLKFNIVANRKMTNCNSCILEMASHRASEAKFGASGVLVVYIWGNFDFVMFKVISESLDALIQPQLFISSL